MGDNYDEFCKSAESATKNGTSFTFFKYSKNLRYDAVGVYSYGSKIAHIDLKQKTIQKIGPFIGLLEHLHNHHYIYAKHMFQICYDIREECDTCDFIHVEHLSYDDHT